MHSPDQENPLISEAGFSKDFIAVTAKNDITRLKELLFLSTEQLMNLSDFTFNLVSEYRDYLTEHNLEAK